MWKIISLILPWFIVIIIFSQVILPLILKKDMFWLFKKKKAEEKISLEDEVDETGEKVTELKNKVNEHYKDAETLKRKSDSI